MAGLLLTADGLSWLTIYCCQLMASGILTVLPADGLSWLAYCCQPMAHGLLLPADRLWHTIDSRMVHGLLAADSRWPIATADSRWVLYS